MKLAWGVPRWTHNYYVEHVLSAGIPHVRQQILCQYLEFFKNLRRSASPEIQLLVNIVGRDAGSVLGSNLIRIEEEFGLDPWGTSSAKLAQVYKYYSVPELDEWRLPLLVKLLDQRREMSVCEERTVAVSELIDSLCHS